MVLPEPPALVSRLGSAAIGLLAGLFIGPVLAVAATVLLRSPASFPLFVFGGGAVGALAAFTYTEVALAAVAGIIGSLAIAFLSSCVFFAPESVLIDHLFEQAEEKRSLTWLELAFWLCFAAGLVLLVIRFL